MQITESIDMELSKELLLKIDAKQKDTKSRFLQFNLLYNFTPVDLTNNSVKVYGVKPDGTLIFNNVTILDAPSGKVLLELTNQALAADGELQCELVIYGNDGSILSSKQFIINVLKSLRDDSAVESSNEFTLLATALADVKKWDDQFTSIYPNLDQKYSTRLNALEGMQIGTRNYLKNSGYPASLNYWNTNRNGDLVIANSPTLGHNVFTLSCNPSESDIFMYSDYVQVERDASTYIFSFYAIAISGGQNCEVYIMYTDDAGQIGTTNFKSYAHQYIGVSSSEIKKYELSVNVPAGTKAMYVRIDNNAPASSTQASQVYIWNLKLEKGIKSTDWTIAPEDMQAYVDNVQVGGNNCLSNSGFKNGFYKWGTNGANVSIDYITQTPKGNFSVIINQSGLTSNAYRGIQSYKYPCNPGDKFTLSAVLKTDDISKIDQKACIEIDFLDSNNNRIYYSMPAILDTSSVWKKFNCTAIAPANAVSVYAFIYLQRNGKVWIGDVKLESGDKATDWTPALEDTQALCPTGAVQAFAMASAPQGWLKCNGAAISRTDYANLFTAIGTTFGTGDGSTTFNVPDLRGQFIRGFDDEKGIDSQRKFGSAQQDNFKAHAHNVIEKESGRPIGIYGGADNGSVGVHEDGFGRATTFLTDSTGSTETVPKNIALLYCIKY